MAGLAQVKIEGPARNRHGDKQPGYARDLEEDLKKKVDGEVRFDKGARALYSTDGSNYRQAPIGVVIPRHVADIVEAMKLCSQYGAPVLARGGGTSLCGNCCNVAVVIDHSKYMRDILELDPRNKRARVQPGVVTDDLRFKAEDYHLTWAPDPATHSHNTFGGMIGNNSCGIHALMGGKTEENTEELDILTYDGLRMRVGRTGEDELNRIIREGGRRGEIYAGMKRIRDKYADLIRARYPKIPRRVSGYNLQELLPEHGFDVAKLIVGSECTLAMVLEATVKLVYSPPSRTLLVIGYPNIYEAGDHVMEILEEKPVGLEGVDHLLFENIIRKGLHQRNLKLLPEGMGWLLVEFGGETRRESDGKARDLMKRLKRKGKPESMMKLYDDKAEEDKVWQIRESGLGATAFVPGQPPAWTGWEDSAVPPDKVGPYLRDLCKLFEKHGYQGALYGHFGQGCIHTRISFDLFSAGGIKRWKKFLHEAADMVIGKYGGSLSGEHGDGQSRAEFLPVMYGEDLIRAFNELKTVWDPKNKMNPGKVVFPYGVDENLKYGTDYHPPQLKTHFSFINEEGWSGAVNRCVGVGKCRREGGGTMCPSYMVTHEEEHSTRGRSRMLFEMLQGEVITDGWKSREVFDALDLCLSCKGCKGDCPVNVDMATYKAEFLSHYYEGKLRPRYAYSMGLIHWWARLASLAPNLANFVTQTPGLSNLAKAIGGISQKRKLPPFAPQTFKDWFARRPERNQGRPDVILWPDTFNNFFHVRTAQAAVEVLEDAGYHVIVPMKDMCCGRPLYDYGMLDVAERLLLDIMGNLRPLIRRGVPMVGIEPSCTAVFRDELNNLYPNDDDAHRLVQQTFTLGEFLDKKADGYKPPPLKRQAKMHVHCQHDAIMRPLGEINVLKKMGVELDLLDSGCCGMAGSFGFEPGKYDISMKCGERVLLPAVREAPKDTIIVADGFSCKTQIEENTDRKGLHLAQVLQMAKHEGAQGPKGRYPEKGYLKQEVTNHRHESTAVLVAGGALAGGALLAWALSKKNARGANGEKRHGAQR
jgi:FAD/FMN-containing dehydrogenase/Fe-S oxidoreductase